MKTRVGFYFLAVLVLTGFGLLSCDDDDDNGIEVGDPKAEFDVSEDRFEPETFHFTNKSWYYDSLKWEFGDGNTSKEEEPSHSYSEAGVYTVKLTVMRGDLNDTATRELTVLPDADFNYSVDEDDLSLVHFTNNSWYYESVEWDFGDGNTSTEESPSHQYEEAGTYTVELTVKYGDLSGETSREITIVEQEIPNVFTGGDMNNPDAWTVYRGGDGIIEHNFVDGTLVFTGDAAEDETWQTHVWQSFEIEEAGDYVFFAHVSGGGFNNAYIEFDMGSSAPEEGTNYAPENEIGSGVNPDNGKVAGINFWIDEGGVEPFDGNIVEIGNDGPAIADEEGTNGIISFNQPGTYYILIKAGTWNGSMGDGVTVHEISLKKEE